MPWIESHTNVSRHRKTVECASALRIPVVHFVGHLHLLWHAVLEQQADGDLAKWSDAAISAAALYTGSAPRFVAVLISNGFLDSDRKIHDWLDYAGKYLTRKYGTSDKQRLIEIWAKHGRQYGSAHAPSSDHLVTSKRPVSDQTVISTLPNSTLPNLSEIHSLGDVSGEAELMKACKQVLGQAAMERWGGVWRKRIREKESKVRRVLLSIQEEIRNGMKIRNRGGYANDMWERFAD